MYWWKNLKLKYQIIGKPILKVTGEGCQAYDEFNWIGKVTGFENGSIYNGSNKPCEYVVIEILKHNKSYSDSRDNIEKEVYKYPLVNADIQNVNGVWVLFT